MVAAEQGLAVTLPGEDIPEMDAGNAEL